MKPVPDGNLFVTLGVSGAEQAKEATSWRGRHGWKAILSPAIAGQGEGSSGGVGILARDFLGLHEPLWGSTLSAGRLINAFVHIPGDLPLFDHVGLPS